MKPFEFDLNAPPPIDDEVQEAGQPCIHHVPMVPAERSLQPQVYPSRGPIEVVELSSDDEDEDNHKDEVREAGQPCIHHVPMAPAERSLQPQVYPSRGQIEVVELDSDNEDEVNHEDEGRDDDDGEDGDDDEEDDDRDDDDSDEEDDNDDGYSYNLDYNDEDVAAGGDDVIISSPISYGQASSSLRAHGRTSLIDTESLQIADIHQRNVRRRVEPQPRVNICDFTVDLGGTRSSMPEPVAPPPLPPLAPTSNHPTCMRLVEASSSMPNPVAPPPPAPPRLPTYECPICREPLVEQGMATRCGHLFCEGCITAAVGLQTKCPICRRKVTDKQINKIYFPLEASSSMPPTFECPICWGPLVEQMATRCGHMFCEGCIRDAVDFQAKCPICRRKVVHRELNRIYFPTCN